MMAASSSNHNTSWILSKQNIEGVSKWSEANQKLAMKCLVFLALFVTVYCEIKEEDDVLVVTTANWDEAVTDDANVLVEFCKSDSFLVSVLFCSYS